MRKPLKENTSSAILYQSIVELPLKNFKDCLLRNNFYALVISGHATPTELEQRWEDLFSEYVDAIGDLEYKLYLRLHKEVSIISTDLYAIEQLIALLAEFPDQHFKDHLCDMLMYDFELDDPLSDKYFSELKRAWNMSRALKMELDLKSIQLKAIQKKFSSKDGKPTDEYFNSVLITLSDHAGYLLHDDISVWDFCERMRRFNQHCDNLKKQTRK